MRTYKFFRKETGEWEDVEREMWGWEAQFEDGSILKQFGDDGTFHQFTEIDQSKLAVFRMTSEVHPHSYTILFSDPKMKLIHFYRNSILNGATEFETRVRFYCFGYEKKVGTKTEKVVMIITPNNELITTEDPNLVLVS